MLKLVLCFATVCASLLSPISSQRPGNPGLCSASVALFTTAMGGLSGQKRWGCSPEDEVCVLSFLSTEFFRMLRWVLQFAPITPCPSLPPAFLTSPAPCHSLSWNCWMSVTILVFDSLFNGCVHFFSQVHVRYSVFHACVFQGSQCSRWVCL